MALALLNMSIITTDGTYSLQTITLQEAKDLLRKAGGRVNSAIGHQATADLLTTLLGVDVPVHRQEYQQKPGETALVLKVNRRPPEGAILTRDLIERMGYTLKKQTRIC